jgi:carbamoyl-phosphate synthase large subunit
LIKTRLYIKHSKLQELRYCKKNLYASVNDIDKKTSLNVIKKYGELGFSISASSGTYKFLSENGVKCSELDLDTAVEYIKDKKIDVVINTATQGYNTTRQGFILRHTALAHDKIVFTCLDTANAYINAILTEKNKENIEYRTMGEYLQEPAIRS